LCGYFCSIAANGFHSHRKKEEIMTQENGGITDAAREAADKVWVTLTGLPLRIKLEWPFHQSTSGADFWVLHGDIRLEGSDELHAERLHAPVAVNLSQTVREVMPSLESKDAEAPVINALRKEVDRRQIEFLKSGKLLPVPFSSRHYDFKRKQWVFGKATDEVMAEFVERKVYWETRLGKSPLLATPARSGAPQAGCDAREIPRPAGENTGLRDDAAAHASSSRDRRRVWIGDPAEAQYLQTTPGHLVEIACRLVETQGLVKTDGEWVEATPALMDQAERFENARRAAVEELEKKHAFERG
jgi:hypothetical protein